MSSPLISVVVCTYNRADLVRQALQSLREQTADPATFEVIVVDNVSTDRTAAVVHALIERGWAQLSYVYEPEQGLSVARNTGMRRARGTYVAYIDDDARAAPDWIESVARCARERSPDGIGGPIMPYYVTERPDWFLDRYQVRPITGQSRYLVYGESFCGSNMAFRKKVLEDLNGFSARYGMRGDRLGWGEETDLCRRYFKYTARPTFYCSQDAIVYHLVARDQMDVMALFRASASMDKSVIEAPHLEPSLWLCLARLAKHAPLLVWDVLGGQFLRDRAAFPHRQNYLYEVALPRTRLIASVTDYVWSSLSPWRTERQAVAGPVADRREAREAGEP